MKNILEAASNLYQSNLDLKNFAKWPDDLVNSNLPPRMIPAAKLVEMSDAKVAAFVFAINLFDLGGSDNLVKKGYKVENLMDFPGH